MLTALPPMSSFLTKTYNYGDEEQSTSHQLNHATALPTTTTTKTKKSTKTRILKTKGVMTSKMTMMRISKVNSLALMM
jgi:hypothetical protein